MANLGIHVLEQATAVSIPVVADSGLPYVTGVSPIHTATKPGKVNTPILCTSWDEAVQKLGFSYDWKTYPICEFIYSHFQLYGCQPVIFCNVMNPEKMKQDVETVEYSVEDHTVNLPLAAISSTISVSSNGADLVEDEDYSIYYDYKTDACVVELLETGESYDAASLSISYTEVKPDKVVLADIVEGVTHVDDCMPRPGPTIPLLRQSWRQRRLASWACSMASA